MRILGANVQHQLPRPRVKPIRGLKINLALGNHEVNPQIVASLGIVAHNQQLFQHHCEQMSHSTPILIRIEEGVNGVVSIVGAHIHLVFVGYFVYEELVAHEPDIIQEGDLSDEVEFDVPGEQ